MVPLFGLTVVGYYQFGIQILTVISLIPVILYNYLLPQASGGKHENIRKTQFFGIICSIVGSILLISFNAVNSAAPVPFFRNGSTFHTDPLACRSSSYVGRYIEFLFHGQRGELSRYFGCWDLFVSSIVINRVIGPVF